MLKGKWIFVTWQDGFKPIYTYLKRIVYGVVPVDLRSGSVAIWIFRWKKVTMGWEWPALYANI